MKAHSSCVVFIFALHLCILLASAAADDTPQPIRPISTYSIIAYDTATGQFGAAVQSHYFRVADVIWVEPSVGAVATQSLVDFNYGPLGLAMMRSGKTAPQSLAGLLASDPDNDVRQVAMIDTLGLVATHTGARCISEAGHQTGVFYSVQANLMEKATVWPAMAKAFESTEGDLAEKMLSALEAAEAEGGDIRGKQSAALKICKARPTGQAWSNLEMDVRIDDSPLPLMELRRLVNIARAYHHMDLGDIAITEGRFDDADREYTRAEELNPENTEICFWRAVTLASVGENDRAVELFRHVIGKEERWRALVPRLVDAGLMPDDPDLIERITRE